jgi:hypothetical protein
LKKFVNFGFSAIGYGHEVIVFQKALMEGIQMIRTFKQE